MKKVQGKNHQQTGFHSHFPKMPKVRPQHIHLLSCSLEDIAAQSLETNFKAQKSHKMCYRESLCMCQIHYNMRNMHTNTHYKNILPPQIPPRVLNWPQRFLCIHSGAIWPQLKKRKKKKVSTPTQSCPALRFHKQAYAFQSCDFLLIKVNNCSRNSRFYNLLKINGNSQ